MPIPDFRDVPVLVTGGAGFIGSHLVDALVERGARVTVLDDLSSGFETNLDRVRPRIRLLTGDIRDPEACREAVSGSEYVFHLAARGSVPRSMQDPVSTIDINIRGTATVFTACREAHVPAVVYASSSSVYGDSTALPKREGEEGRPLSPYALSKMANEQLADVFVRCFGMRILGLRYFNVFGPRQNPAGPYAAVVPRFFDAAIRAVAPQIHGDGEQSRDFTYVIDVITANLMAAGAPAAAFGSAYNIAPGKGTTIRDLAERIVRVCGSPATPEYLPPRAGDIRHSQADWSKAREAFGYAPQWSLLDGLEASRSFYAEGRFPREGIA